MKSWTSRKIRASKGKEKLPCLTAYDAITARLVDEAGIPLILVGDSLATTALGFETTISATKEMMLHHAAAVARVVKNALVVADMPFLTYHFGAQEVLRNAGLFLQKAGADAVKLEGGAGKAQTIELLVDNGIPVMAHIGVLPQSVRETGYHYRGSTVEDVKQLVQDAQAVAKAGAFAVVLECVSDDAAKKITEATPIPTIGIGSGVNCDGQVLVLADLLGLTQGPMPRFVKKFANVNEIAAKAIAQYRDEVMLGRYPTEAHTYGR